MAVVDARTGFQLPASSDVEQFTDQVDEACRLIAGLQTGDVSPEEFDRREAARSIETSANQARTKPDTASQPQVDPEKQQQLQQKIADLQSNLRKKEAARNRYRDHVSQQSQQHTTDYTKWDLFTPDDEEDDLINSLTPNNPQMKAMEADIDARHARMVSQRQLAERQRVEGNTLYAQGQYSAAFQCYETGLEAERHNMALHSNAAQVLIKMGCYVQAIEHCDKVLHLAEFLHNRPSDPMCAKALWRRAAARKELKHYSEAVDDLQHALQLQPANKSFAKELEQLRLDIAEHRRQRAVLKQLASSNSIPAPSHAAGATHAQPTEQPSASAASAGPLNQLEGLVQQLHSAAERVDRESCAKAKGPCGLGKGLPLPKAKGSSQMVHGAKQIAELCAEMTKLLQASDDCRVCLRECSGVDRLCSLLTEDTMSSAFPALLRVLVAACRNDYNCKAAAKQGAAGLAAKLLSSNSTETVFESVCLLYTLTTVAETRLAVGQALVRTQCLQETPAVDQLIVLLATSDAGTQAMTLSLLGNTATLPEVLKAVSGSGQSAVATVTKLLSSQDPGLKVKAATLVGNLCHDASLRSQITASKAAVASLLSVLSQHAAHVQMQNSLQPHSVPSKQSSAPQPSSSRHASSSSSSSNAGSQLPSHPTSYASSPGGSDSRDAALAAATALNNLLLDKDAQRLVCDLQGIATVSKLLLQTDWILAARVAGILARLAQQPRGHAQMLSSGALDCLLQLLEASFSAGTGDDVAWQAQVQDSAARLMATLASAHPPAVTQIAQGAGMSLLLTLLRTSDVTSNSTALGNASMCISELAKRRELLPLLRKQDAVAPLLDVAYKCQGRTQKNAAIAVARLAHDEACMQRVRELHGLDIIYQYVKR